MTWSYICHLVCSIGPQYGAVEVCYAVHRTPTGAPSSIIIEVEKMRLQYVHVVEDSVEGKQQASPKLELEQDEETNLDVETAGEQSQDREPV